MELARGHVLVCGGTGCTSSGSTKIIEEFETSLRENGLADEIKVVKTGCFGLCALGPIVIVYPEGAFYSMVKPEDVHEIVEEHLLKGRIVKRLLYQETIVEDNNVLTSSAALTTILFILFKSYLMSLNLLFISNVSPSSGCIYNCSYVGV